MVIDPAGTLYSALEQGRFVRGLVPYWSAIQNPDECTCISPFTHIVCPDPLPGEWRAVAGVVPAGAEPKLSNVITIAEQTVMVNG